MSFFKKAQQKQKETKGLRVVVYGEAGVGKSTFAYNFHKPVVIGTNDEITTEIENGFKLEPALNSKQLSLMLQECVSFKDDYATLVIDSITSVQNLFNREVCKKKNVESVGDLPHGRGWVSSREKMSNFLAELNELQVKIGWDIVLLGHSNGERGAFI